MYIRFISVIGAALLFLSGFANAEVPNYNYAELSGVIGEYDEDDIGDIDQDGFRLDASTTLMEDKLWLFASYADTDGDEDFFVTVDGVGSADVNVDLEVETILVGFGIILEPNGLANSTVDFSLRYRTDDFDAKVSSEGVSVSADDDAAGFGASFGIRSNITDAIEVFGRLGILTTDYDNNATYELGSTWNIGERFGVTAAYEYIDIGDDFEAELSNFRLGARFKW